MKGKLIEIVRLTLIVLFVYTAANKIMTLDHFIIALAQFPLLKKYSGFLAYFIPLSEIGISLVLIFPKLYVHGMRLSLGLMLSFTIYLTYAVWILGYKKLPCSCGGVISKLSWKQHLYFNIVIILLITWSLFIRKGKKLKKDTRTDKATLSV